MTLGDVAALAERIGEFCVLGYGLASYTNASAFSLAEVQPAAASAERADMGACPTGLARLCAMVGVDGERGVLAFEASLLSTLVVGLSEDLSPQLTMSPWSAHRCVLCLRAVSGASFTSDASARWKMMSPESWKRLALNRISRSSGTFEFEG
eukprot:CAMPEP_0119305614 /NCGR_PEP_ID=MMETSP1333-20130426/6576_1 /TAXON_ID=418940 /ORGANISM="Scyphosphaera apsteinii, Strain RCC1455" /LENGTH=151 /DNA_ID=CAMNT_0007308753 /DNA_START=696 /DNA_END=1150 /DNA_ORIENTATION=+